MHHVKMLNTRYRVVGTNNINSMAKVNKEHKRLRGREKKYLYAIKENRFNNKKKRINKGVGNFIYIYASSFNLLITVLFAT